MSDWKAVMIGQEDAGPLIARAGLTLDRVLQARPDGDRELLEIVGKRLEPPIGEKTMDGVRSSLTNYAGEDAAFLVLWISQTDQAGRLAQVEASASPRVAALVRAMLGLYGTELITAYSRWNEPQDDWTLIEREIYHDLILERIVVKVRVHKKSGEITLIEGPASSILELAANMVRTCNMVGRADAFAPRVIEMMMEEVGQFYELLKPFLGDSAKPSTGETVAPAGQGDSRQAGNGH